MGKEREWTDSEIEFLIENFNKLTYKQIGEKINRTESSITHKLQRLNFKKQKRHGLSQSKLYNVWSAIKDRCTNYADKYKHYSGRGIKMCEEWMNSGFVFCNWAIENGYKDGLSIDRIDVNGDYEPNNCRFVDAKVQANNRRNNILVTAFGETKSVSMWSRDKRCNIKLSGLMLRLKNGWEPEKAITTISKKRHINKRKVKTKNI